MRISSEQLAEWRKMAESDVFHRWIHRATMFSLLDEIEAEREAHVRTKEALRQVEWDVVSDSYGNPVALCRVCGGFSSAPRFKNHDIHPQIGHAADCIVGAALRGEP